VLRLQFNFDKLDKRMAEYIGAKRSWSNYKWFVKAHRKLVNDWEKSPNMSLHWPDIKHLFSLYYREDLVDSAIDETQRKQSVGEGKDIEIVRHLKITNEVFAVFLAELLRTAEERCMRWSKFDPSTLEPSDVIPCSYTNDEEVDMGNLIRTIPADSVVKFTRDLRDIYRSAFEGLAKL